ncbi:MAG TPA: hypothetical protein VKE40_04635 [Gemmataceae bacterium]|nr:hypothetical protein [Gemmataceae bacterium]
MTTLYAVYQYGWQDSSWHETPLGNGVTQPCRALIGLYRDQAKAEWTARRIRRRVGAALGARAPGDGKALPMINVGRYNPLGFLADQERWRDEPTRAEAHRRVVAGVSDWQARLRIACTIRSPRPPSWPFDTIAPVR